MNESVQRVVMGDASETALLKFTELTIGNIVDYRARFKKICEVPFNSTNKFQVRFTSKLQCSCIKTRSLRLVDYHNTLPIRL